MKKYLSVLLVSSIMVLCLSTVALAQTTGVQGAKKQEIEKLKNEIKEVKDATKKEKDDLKATLDSDRNTTGTASGEAEPKTREQVKADIQKIRDDARQKIEDLKTSIGKIKSKAKATLAQARIMGREDSLNRFDQAIEKITTLTDKVNSQITKLEAKGLNVQIAKDMVKTAEGQIVEAKQKVADASTILSASTNELSKADKEKITQISKDTQSLINAAHQSLNDAVQYLKTLVVKMPVGDTETSGQ